MAAYKFEATDASGREINDVIVAGSEEEARATISKRGCVVTMITVASTNESSASTRGLADASYGAKGGVGSANGEATERAGSGPLKYLSMTQTFKDYLAAAAIVGAALATAVGLGMELEMAQYAVPFLAFAVVACQYWRRWQWSATPVPAASALQPRPPGNARMAHEPLPHRAMRFGLLYAVLLALGLIAGLLTVLGPASR